MVFAAETPTAVRYRTMQVTNVHAALLKGWPDAPTGPARQIAL